MKAKAWIIALSILFGTSSAYAMVFGGSNLGIFGYPKHTCSKPYKPYRFSTQYEFESYKYEYEAFIACIETYIENAKNDISRIRESANEVVEEANR